MILMSLITNSIGQSKPKSFEISVFTGTALSFSKLTVSHTNQYSSPPSFGIMYGVKLNKMILDSAKNLSVNTCYTSQELSISSKLYIREKSRSLGHTSTYLPIYDIWSIGIKKSFNLSANFYFDTEFGQKLHFARNHTYKPKDFVIDYLDSLVTYNFRYVSHKNTTLIPYLGCGVSFRHKKILLEVFFWTQRSFVPVLKFDTYTKYGSSIFRSDVISYGFAIGGQLGFKVFSF